MSTAKSKIAMLLLMVGIFLSPAKAGASSGITVSPADITLNLHKGQAEQQATINFTNHYDQTVILHLSVAVTQNAITSDSDVLEAITFDDGDSLIVDPGKTASKTLRLHDFEELRPGSQRVDLVITQDAAPGSVGVSPQLRLPLVTIKEDGAVTALGLSDIKRPVLALTLPKKITLQLNNTGNMQTIPRGTVAIKSPNGRTLAQGALNTGSLAIAPGHSLKLDTPLTKLGNGLTPGEYVIAVSYGLGGDNPTKTAMASLYYMPWWQLVSLLTLIFSIYPIKKYLIPKIRGPRFRSIHRSKRSRLARGAIP